MQPKMARLRSTAAVRSFRLGNYGEGENDEVGEVDEDSYGDIGGIYFVLSRAETERYKDREKNYDDEDEEDEEDDKTAELEEEKSE